MTEHSDRADSVNPPFDVFPDSALDGSILARFQHIASRHWDQIAVSDDRREMTYGDVTSLSGRIAATINAVTGTRPGQIAILLENEARYAPAMLGVLAAGRAFVPLNAEHPIERNQQIVTHAQAVAIVTDGPRAQAIRGESADGVPVIDLDALAPTESPAWAAAGPDDLAYIPFTSGSTGRPKGVRRHHRGLLHYTQQTTNTMRIGPTDRLVTFNSPSLTEGLIITFCALLNGARVLCMPPADLAPASLAKKLRSSGATIVWTVPRLFRYLVDALPPDQQFDTLRLVALAGDRVDWSDIEIARWGCPADTLIRVGFGSTEAGVHTQWFVDETLRGTSVRLPVGRVPTGQRLAILDEDGRPVPDGEPGEVVVTSPSVALGYWCDDEATARSFSADPGDPRVRSYRTGDQVIRRPDGLIEYAGRKDQQIKLNGQRLELGEVESALMACPDVRDAAVVVRRTEAGVPVSLSAWCQVDDPANTTPRDLTTQVAARVPRHMVPGTITIVEALPRLPNFKIDRETLGRRDREIREEKPIAPPRTETEARLAELWAEAFSSPEIGRDDHFFELGGDSLAAATIGIGVQDAFGGEIDLSLIAEHPTLAELAAAIDRMAVQDPDEIPLEPVTRDTPPPLSFIQETIWRTIQTPEQVSPYIDTTAWRIHGPLDVDALRWSLAFLIGRHEILRTTFDEIDGAPVQIIHPPDPAPLPLFDLSRSADPETEARSRVEIERTTFTSLCTGPLLRFQLLRLGDSEHWLVQTTNHLILDAVSRDIFARELGLLYDARSRGDAAPLPDRAPLHYGDYTSWLRRTLRPGTVRYQNEVAWWHDLFTSAVGETRLPFERATRARNLPPEEGSIRWSLNPKAAAGILDLARSERTTPYAVRLAAFALSLMAENGAASVLIGAHIDQRTRAPLRDMIGSFVNVVALNLDRQAGLSFRAWVRFVGDRVARAVAHGDIPYQTLIETLHAMGRPVPRVEMIFHSFVLGKIALPGLDVGIVDRGYTLMPAGFTMTFREHDDDRDCSLAFDANRYDAVRVRDFTNRFIAVLEAAVGDPDRSIDDLAPFHEKPRPPIRSGPRRSLLGRIVDLFIPGR